MTKNNDLLFNVGGNLVDEFHLLVKHIIDPLRHSFMPLFSSITLLYFWLFLLRWKVKFFVVKFFQIGTSVLTYLRQTHQLMLYFLICFVQLIEFRVYFIDYYLCSEGSTTISSFNTRPKTSSITISIAINGGSLRSTLSLFSLCWIWHNNNFE